jgi:hypothetical protein
MWIALVVVCAAAGCSKAIGDACGTNVDCSIAGDRFCDIAPPGGYCTVEGCDVTNDGKDTCPGDSVCVRFFTSLGTEPCTYDVTLPRSDCAADQRCVCDQSDENGTCPISAHCAPETSERRWCMARCGKDGDCRDGYVCRETGTFGAEPVPSVEKPLGENAKFCVSGTPTSTVSASQ